MKSKLWTTLLLALALSALLLSGCVEIHADSMEDTREVVRGSGDVVVENRDVSDLNRVSLTGFGQVTITQGDEEALTIETDDNLMQYIVTEVINGRLVLGFTREGQQKNIRPSDGIRFNLSVKDVTGLNLSGAGNINVASLETERLDITLSGAGNVNVGALTAEGVSVHLSGAGDVELAGRVTEQDVFLSGAGSYRAARLESQTANVKLSGAGNVAVWATETLDGCISGVGNVEYYGSPSVTKSGLGIGKVFSRGNP